MEISCLAKEAENKFRLIDTDLYVIGFNLSQAIERQRRRGQFAEEFENEVACSQSEKQRSCGGSKDRIEVLTVSD